jgi:hypothetical protein
MTSSTNYNDILPIISYKPTKIKHRAKTKSMSYQIWRMGRSQNTFFLLQIPNMENQSSCFDSWSRHIFRFLCLNSFDLGLTKGGTSVNPLHVYIVLWIDYMRILTCLLVLFIHCIRPQLRFGSIQFASDQ